MAHKLYTQLSDTLMSQGKTKQEADQTTLAILRKEAYGRFLDNGDNVLFSNPYNSLENTEIAQLIGDPAEAVRKVAKENAVGLHLATLFGNKYSPDAYRMINAMWNAKPGETFANDRVQELRELYEHALAGITRNKDHTFVVSDDAKQELPALLAGAAELVRQPSRAPDRKHAETSEPPAVRTANLAGPAIATAVYSDRYADCDCDLG